MADEPTAQGGLSEVIGIQLNITGKEPSALEALATAILSLDSALDKLGKSSGETALLAGFTSAQEGMRREITSTNAAIESQIVQLRELSATGRLPTRNALGQFAPAAPIPSAQTAAGTVPQAYQNFGMGAALPRNYGIGSGTMDFELEFAESQRLANKRGPRKPKTPEQIVAVEQRAEAQVAEIPSRAPSPISPTDYQTQLGLRIAQQEMGKDAFATVDPADYPELVKKYSPVGSLSREKSLLKSGAIDAMDYSARLPYARAAGKYDPLDTLASRMQTQGAPDYLKGGEQPLLLPERAASLIEPDRVAAIQAAEQHAALQARQVQREADVRFADEVRGRRITQEQIDLPINQRGVDTGVRQGVRMPGVDTGVRQGVYPSVNEGVQLGPVDYRATGAWATESGAMGPFVPPSNRASGLPVEQRILASKMGDAEYTKLTTEATKAEIDTLAKKASTVRSVTGEIDLYNKGVTNSTEFANRSARANDGHGISIARLGKHVLETMVIGQAAYTAFQMAGQAITALVSNYGLLDAAASQTAYAMGVSTAATREYAMQAAIIGAQYGQGQTESVGAFVQASRYTKDPASQQQLMQSSNQMASITGESPTDSMANMITMTQQWKLEAKDSSRVVDLQAMALKNTSIPMNDYIDAMSKASGAGKMLGLTLEEMGGFVAAFMQITHSSAAETNTFMERISTASVRPEIQKKLWDDFKIGTFDKTTGNALSSMQVLDAIAVKWKAVGDAAMSTEEKTSLATVFAGPRQSTEFTNFMDQYAKVKSTMDLWKTGSGEGAAASAAMMNNIQAQANRVMPSVGNVVMQALMPSGAMYDAWTAFFKTIADQADRFARDKKNLFSPQGAGEFIGGTIGGVAPSMAQVASGTGLGDMAGALANGIRQAFPTINAGLSVKEFATGMAQTSAQGLAGSSELKPLVDALTDAIRTLDATISRIPGAAAAIGVIDQINKLFGVEPFKASNQITESQDAKQRKAMASAWSPKSSLATTMGANTADAVGPPLKPQFGGLQMTDMNDTQITQLGKMSAMLSEQYLAAVGAKDIEQANALRAEWDRIAVVMRTANGEMRVLYGLEAANVSQAEKMMGKTSPKIQSMPQLNDKYAEMLYGFIKQYETKLAALGIKQTPETVDIFGQGGKVYQYNTSQEAMDLARNLLLEKIAENTQQLRGSYNIPSSFGYRPPTPWEYYDSGKGDMGPVNYPWMQDGKGKIGEVGAGGLDKIYSTSFGTAVDKFGMWVSALTPVKSTNMDKTDARVLPMGIDNSGSYDFTKNGGSTAPSGIPNFSRMTGTYLPGMQGQTSGSAGVSLNVLGMAAVQSNTSQMASSTSQVATNTSAGLGRVAMGIIGSNALLGSMLMQLISISMKVAKPPIVNVYTGLGKAGASVGTPIGTPTSVGAVGNVQNFAGVNVVGTLRE